MIGIIAISFLLQVVSTLGIVVLFGLLTAQCNKWFYSNFGNYGRAVCYITGAVGTPVHECAHALFCLVFGHKILKIKFFQINSDDGTLGYVNHAYNKKNVYQVVGNFFIGIGPIIVISAMLYVFSMILLPNFVSRINIITMDNLVGDIENAVSQLFVMLVSFFSCAVTWQWWVFILIGVCLSLHMTLSVADIKLSLSGLIIILLALLTVDVILGLSDKTLLISFTNKLLQIGSYLFYILSLSLTISIIAVLISYVFKIVKSRNKNSSKVRL